MGIPAGGIASEIFSGMADGAHSTKPERDGLSSRSHSGTGSARATMTDAQACRSRLLQMIP